MKILVVSLLRLGDILLSTAVLRSLKKQYPHAELHILINGQFASVAKLIPYVSKVHCFQREKLQQLIGSSEHSLLEAYYRVEDLVRELREEHFDQAINLTHNRLSGWLMALIDCPDTRGVTFGAGRFSIGSNWFDYLNNVTEPGEGEFHFVDVFHYGIGLENIDRRIELVQSSRAKDFAEKLFCDFKTKKRILIQPGSNEAKKTFTADKWRKIAATINQMEPNGQVFILGASPEKSLLDQICDGNRSIAVVCDLEEAFGLLNQSHLLLTGDTSVMHLAAATKTKILQVSLGSSEYRKTGAYTHGAVIIQGLAPCAPCSHKSECTQPTHECAEKVLPEMVSMAVSAILRQDEPALRLLAHEYREEAQVLKTHINNHGDWSAYPLAQAFSARQINEWIDRTSIKLQLQKAPEKLIGEYGSEGIELKQLLEYIFPDRSHRDWVSQLKTIERDMAWFEGQIETLLSKLKSLLSQIDNREVLQDYLDELEKFCAQAQRVPSFESYVRQMALNPHSFSTAQGAHFEIVKKLREKLSLARQRAKIELKLIRGLQTEFMEIV